MQLQSGAMELREERAHLAASMYYEQGLTMSAVARRLGVSRSSVSRLLAYAREKGIVTIRVASLEQAPGGLAAAFERRWGVNSTIVPALDVDSPATRLNSVAAVAAGRLTESMEPGMILGVAWGNTTTAVAAQLTHAPKPGSTVVQLNGAANALDMGTLYADSIISAYARAFGSSAIHFPVPAFFDYPETKQQMGKERSIRRVTDAIASCDVALFGVGAVDPAMPSHVYAGGYLDEDEWERAFRDGVVGDVCTVLLREDGSTDMELNARASGPSPEALKKIPRRIAVVASPGKVRPLIGALRAGVITDLVIDAKSARTALNRVVNDPSA